MDAPTWGKAGARPNFLPSPFFLPREGAGSGWGVVGNRGNPELWAFARPIYNGLSETTLRRPASSVRFPTAACCVPDLAGECSMFSKINHVAIVSERYALLGKF